MTTTRPRTTTSLIALATLSLLAAAPSRAQDQDRMAHKIETSRLVFQDLMNLPEKKIPQGLLEDAKCIAVIPNVIKGAFIWGGRRGRGVMTCRRPGDGWSQLSFVKLTGGSFGFQIGGQATDLVLFFTNERGARSLVRSKFVLGVDASVAAGSIGRTAEATTDLRLKAEIFAYAKARGLFAGASIEGARLVADQKWNRRYYRQNVWADELLFEDRIQTAPASSAAFLDQLP